MLGKKKLLASQTLFSKNRCVQVGFWFLLLFSGLGTFLDIWVCLAEQNSSGFTGSV